MREIETTITQHHISTILTIKHTDKNENGDINILWFYTFYFIIYFIIYVILYIHKMLKCEAKKYLLIDSSVALLILNQETTN